MWLGLVALTVTAWAAPALADHARADASDWKPRTTVGTVPNLSSSARAPKQEGDLHAWAGRAALLWLLSIRQAGMAPAVHQSSTLPAGVPLAQFWTPPADLAPRDLFLGPALTPAPDATRPLEFVSKKRTGFSAGYDVTDASGRESSVKLGPEAQTEVVASRLVWAAGYHQPPTFYVSRWTLAGGPSPGVQDGARFRPKAPLVSRGSWSWQQNPFVGSQPYRGLVVLMLLLNSTDLRNENNVIYELPQDRPRRNDLESFAHAPLLTIDGEGHQRFAYRGLCTTPFAPAATRPTWPTGSLRCYTPGSRRGCTSAMFRWARDRTTGRRGSADGSPASCARRLDSSRVKSRA